jgi:hypothetical protein
VVNSGKNIDENEEYLMTQISNTIKSHKGESQERLLILMIKLYKKIVGENKNNIDPIKEKNIEKYFSDNIITEAFTIIIRNRDQLNSPNFEKLINILIKIKYQNIRNWKLILNHYLIFLNNVEKTAIPYRTSKFERQISQILFHLKNIYDILPVHEDKELEELIDKSIKNTINFLLNNLEKAEPETVNMLLVSTIKLGYLDDQMYRKLEKPLKIHLNSLSDDKFPLLLSSFFKNRAGTEAFITLLENRAERIIDKFLSNKKSIDTYAVSNIAQGNYV